MHSRYVLQTPIGALTLLGTDQVLEEIQFDDGRVDAGNRQDVSKALEQAAVQLTEYFEGKRNDFDVPLELKGSDFQKKVWNELRNIPYGETISYGDLARRVGNPSAARAVGSANARNPIPIIVPCHRVIGTNGSLVGFGGGLSTKSYLLGLESGTAEVAPSPSSHRL
jgi:methylated-DNA-[protein]-cysteine S-methyltransferase